MDRRIFFLRILIIILFRSLTSNEFIIPLSNFLRRNHLFRSANNPEHQRVSMTTYIPAMEQFLSVRPKLIKEEE